MRKIFGLFILTIVSLIIIACDETCPVYKPNVSGDPVLIHTLLSESKDTLIDQKNAHYFLGSYCWRDFMPTTDKCDYKGLVLSIEFKNNDAGIVPRDFSFQKGYVIYKDSVWIANLKYFSDNPQIGSFVTPDGPLWPVDSIVDVVLELKLQNIKHYVIKRNVTIRAAY